MDRTASDNIFRGARRDLIRDAKSFYTFVMSTVPYSEWVTDSRPKGFCSAPKQDGRHVNAHLIAPGLWLGNKDAAHNVSFIRNKNIGLIVNCTRDIPYANFLSKSIERYPVKVHDNLDPGEINKMADCLPNAVNKIENFLVNNPDLAVLVHCYAGVQRSACVVAAFLMKMCGFSVDQAVKHVRSIRGVAFLPGVNFEPALKAYARYLRRTR